jgi:hypothetical protein
MTYLSYSFGLLRRARSRLRLGRKNILCLGYSVTEQKNGYVDCANEILTASKASFALTKSGWGGHTLDTLAYCIDEIIGSGAFAGVLLEIFTSHIRALGAEQIRFYLDQLLAALAEARLPVGFVYMYDDEVKHDGDFLVGIITDYATKYGIPLLNLVAEIRRYDKAERDKLFFDVVHTTPPGAKLYAERVVAFLSSQPVRSDYIRHFSGVKRRLHAVPLASMCSSPPTFELARNGIPWRFYEIKEGASLSLSLPSAVQLTGAMLTYAPDAGEMRFENARTGEAASIVPYDSHSYYIRSGFFPLNIGSVGDIVIRQTANLPPHTPLKGEKYLGPRVGRISHLFYSSSTV